ncbi:putative TIR domain, P-loop containing nucleoside triphosphate hydrolase [Helianthus annuus]|nr:putative TIR domain, P-loop containing nucleoside triphosphate hydrolase [Helianthus annuus]KAJ0595182.1 putative TIR domain, P-loop containing nucleoside triphosphate hydrolase [Helianthus annuus]KAJ0803542.1 putative TIR domain, P-loop containing nucleoside triphosphate hydrolase [Helianthus annuus]
MNILTPSTSLTLDILYIRRIHLSSTLPALPPTPKPTDLLLRRYPLPSQQKQKPIHSIALLSQLLRACDWPRHPLFTSASYLPHPLENNNLVNLLVQMNTSMASSSSSSHSTPASSSRSCKYDVFLSFRGDDTRKTFVDHLYSALTQHLIRVYKDDETLPRGESINQSLFEAIEESQIALIVFSKNYADSSWCLEELAHIMKCKHERELFVIPIFYDVEPTEVRNQIGKFGEAFSKQETKNVTKAEIWRKALVDVSSISGWELKNIANGTRFQDLKPLLDIGSGGVRMVGIWGVGGGGKTTLASSVYMEMSQHFQGHCILENVREDTSKHGLKKLQENILSSLFKKEVNVYSVIEGKHKMKEMLCHRKVLVVLDDVDELGQLEALAGKHNWFGSGSRIIITTRDEHLLRTHRVDHVYPIALLSNDDATQLFKRHAYNEKEPIEDYDKFSLRAISYASGHPLSLKVLGSFLYDKNKNEWISALEKLKDIPNPNVMNIIKTSYDGLESYEKELFLDIACFFRRWKADKVVQILEASGFHPKIGMKVLIQKALITIVDDIIDMHDVLEEMGHYIVREEHPNNPEKHSRLWINKEIKELCFKDERMEYDKTEAIIYKFGDSQDCDTSWLCKIVSKMKKLRLLSVITDGDLENVEGANFLSNELQYIYWFNYPASPFPHNFQPMKLAVLELYGSKQKELWKGYKHLPQLEVLELIYLQELISTPDFDGLPRLKRLILDCCYKLEEIHPSFRNHTSLEHLEVSYCSKLRLPTISQMKNIKVLQITSCDLKDGDIPYGIGELSNLQELDLCSNNFSRLDFNFSQLTRLKSLNVSWCDNLLELPELPSSLAIFAADKCWSLTLVKDFSTKCKHLCQVSLAVEVGWSDRLLQSMLKGTSIENGCMYLQLGDLKIPKGFTPLLRKGGSCRLELPENWCNDFTGFLMCAVTSYPFIMAGCDISMKQESGMDFEDDGVWKESDGGHYTTLVWYVSFGSLRHTTWWYQTHNAVSLKIESHLRIHGPDRYDYGFGVRLVEKKSRSGQTETSTDSSSHYTPKIKIQHDSTSELKVSLHPYCTD